jgi:sigma-54 dependent transcriptional regulator, acetoin dehydrogenase operon transcriptional activator AcoR
MFLFKERVRARDKFLSQQRIEAMVSTQIARSWKRSRSYNVNVSLRHAPKALSSEELSRLRRYSPLIQSYESIYPRIESYLNERYAVVLADEKGCVLEVSAKSVLRDKFADINVSPGGQLSERVSGTNAIGTALAEGSPVLIHDAEHYCETLQPYSCAGVPICHPRTRKVIGVLDFTSLAEHFPKNALALTVSLVQSIEAELRHYFDLGALRIENVFLEREKDLRDDLLLAFDREGTLLKSNHPSQLYSLCPGFDWSAYFQTLDRKKEKGEKAPWEQCIPFLREQPLGKIIPVESQHQLIGILVQVANPRKRIKRVGLAIPSPVEGLPGLIGKAPVWQQLLRRVKKVAVEDTTVLLFGESGTGKEKLAQAIHELSPRRDKPFIAINCATFVHDLSASELFGYAPGMFTGGLKRGKSGLFEEADGGTLFLDEIGELPPSVQAMLLRVLEVREVIRIGECQPRPVNVRIIAATNRNLKHEVEKGAFRRDLYYRLSAVTLKVPSLRERREDIPFLASHFLRAFKPSDSSLRFSSSAQELMIRYSWPGNVRELKNAVEYAALFTENDEILPEDLPQEIFKTQEVNPPGSPRKVEADEILQVLQTTRFNKTEAAKLLGISRGTLYNWMKKYRIEL